MNVQTVHSRQSQKRIDARRNISKIVDQLEQIEESEALMMSSWLWKKSTYFKKHYKRVGFTSTIPANIERGDIVRTDYGYNIGDEYSDKGQDGHFSLVWAQKGFVFVVIPLTKSPQHENDFSVNLGVIEGMPEETDTWAKLEAIRSVSIRRFMRMKEQPEGKITIKDNSLLMGKIYDKLKEKFC